MRVHRDLVVIEHSRHSLVIALQLVFSSQFESVVCRCSAIAIIAASVALVVVAFIKTKDR